MRLTASNRNGMLPVRENIVASSAEPPRKMRVTSTLIAIGILSRMCAQISGSEGIVESLSPHYSLDSAYSSVDSISFSLPLAMASERIGKCVTSISSAWNKSEVRVTPVGANGMMEFTYMPPNLLEVSRAGYLMTYVTLTWSEGLCVVKMQKWIHRPAVRLLPDMSFGPISKGDRCSMNLCSMLGVAKCTVACNAELWPEIARIRQDVVAAIRKAIDKK